MDSYGGEYDEVDDALSTDDMIDLGHLAARNRRSDSSASVCVCAVLVTVGKGSDN